MNGTDIFVGLSYIDRELVEEAQLGQFPKSKIRSLRRPVLIAALIAMLLMLTGCAVAYVLSVKDMKVGELVGTRPMFSDDQRTYLGETEVPQQVLTLNGLNGTASYQASKEWFEFKQNYDTDHAILNSVWKEWPEYPREYDAYNIYTDEMMEKVDSIAKKYSLNLAGSRTALNQSKVNIYEILGVESLLNKKTDARIALQRCNVYESGNFYLEFPMTMGEGQWAHSMMNCLYFLNKGTFDPNFLSLDVTQDWQEWNYTAKGGSNVLILYPNDDACSYMICDRDDAVLVVRVESSYVIYSEDGNIIETMERRDLEEIADAINFQIQPYIDLSSVGEGH